MSTILIFCIIPASCATLNVNSSSSNTVPKYNGVNELIAPYVEQWMELAADHKLSFQHTVNIGFTNMRDRTVGLTRYENGFREIDIDSRFWVFSNENQKNTLIWHELAHAYCDRSHGYDGGEYGDDLDQAIKSREEGGDGFYSDLCPKSLMFPALVQPVCFKRYFFQYIDEMFKNCNPY
jgi:hypothetical protein